MKKTIKCIGILGLFLTLFLSIAVTADFVVYKPMPKIVYSYDKVIKHEWRYPYVDVRKAQLRSMLGVKPLNLDGTSTTSSLLPIVPSFTPIKNSISFSNCGGRKLYNIKDYDDCMNQGQEYCVNECPKRYSKSCSVCNKRSMTTCTKNILPACNLLFKSRIKQLGIQYYGNR